ncbi:hypothetical protein Zm00014a_000012, partial [Zea mays]
PRRPELGFSSPLELRRALSPGELRPDVRNPERAPIPSPPPYFSLPALTRRPPCSRHRRPGSPSRLCRRRGVPGARLEVRDLSRPYRPLFCSLLRLIARRSRITPPPSRPAAEPPRREPPPSGASAPTQTPPMESPCPPRPPRPLGLPQSPASRPCPSSPASPPPRGRAPPPQLAVGKTQAAHPISDVQPRSGGPDSTRPDLILAVRQRSSGPGPLPPHPVSLPARPHLSVRPRALSARPRLPVARARAVRPAPPVSPAPALSARPRLSAAHAAARPRARRGI